MRLTTTLISAVLAAATAQAQTPAALQDHLDLGGVGEPAWRKQK